MFLYSKFVLQTAGFDGTWHFYIINLVIDCSAFQPASLIRTRQGTGKLGLFLFIWKPNFSLIQQHKSFQNYTDYFKCIAAKGEDFAPCKQFKRAYHSLCPSTSSFLNILPNSCVNLNITR
jgi:cytochrome oxidase c subunit VIb